VKTFFTEATVLPEHKITLDHVPFVEGENVAVFMMAIKKDQADSGTSDLRGSVLTYDSPFEAVASNEWEALA